MDKWDCYFFLLTRYKELKNLDEVLYIILGEANPEINSILIVLSEYRLRNLYEDAFRRDVIKLDRIWIDRTFAPVSYVFDNNIKVSFVTADYERLVGYDRSHTAFMFCFAS